MTRPFYFEVPVAEFEKFEAALPPAFRMTSSKLPKPNLNFMWNCYAVQSDRRTPLPKALTPMRRERMEKTWAAIQVGIVPKEWVEMPKVLV